MQAFITGGTGLLGSNLVRRLLKVGWQVKALVRSPDKAKRVLGDTSATLVEGDMLNVAGFAAELSGCDVLFHTAAYFREYYGPGDHWKKLEAINIKGTTDLLEAAEKAGIHKAIYVSSAGVLGASPNGMPGDESTPPDAHVYENLYLKSKVLAEESVAEFLRTHHMPVVLILPTWMYGPGDSAPTHSGRIIQDYLNGQVPVVTGGGSMVVDARDVAQAMISAVEHGRSGERYIVGGDYYSMERILGTLEKVSGARALKPQIPHHHTSLSDALVGVLVALLRNTKTRVNPADSTTLDYQTSVRSDKAKAELKISFLSLEQTLGDEVAWFRGHEPA